ncbi:type VII secretion protein EccCa [Gordonia sp. NB41Y]|uniref:type VII secretion protein EccCa n=1 Tax=Gordonia sp. NB41Y TaxID=875808 RepID=UPI0006B1D84B|nr:type VII secretion protein EccCa [Gordonia sp. NB41Y]EMP12305.2 secretion protein EccC [Gordonia sp. NB41Y]WLP91629.1 type VII secretion protein EccCa [Gordonia sp. NB41Y]
MTTTEGFVRRPRITPPRTPGGELNIAPPPDVPRVVPGGLLMKLLPVVMIVAVVGMLAMMVATGGRNILSNPLFMMFPLMMLMSMFGMFAAGGRGGGKRAAELNEERKDYFRYLGQLRDEVADTARAQRAALAWTHPDPRVLGEVVGGRRMWERRPADTDFAHARVGLGTQRLATRLMPPETGPLEDIEPVSMVALRRFVRTHSVVHRLPTAVSLRGFPAINIEGVRQDTRELVRAMVIGLCTFHGPDHLRVAIVTRDPAGEVWDWAKWLPHAGHPSIADAVGPFRMIYPSLADLELSLGADLADRGRFSRSAPPVPGQHHLVVVIDDGRVDGTERLVNDAGMSGVTVLDLTAPADGPAARRGLQLVVGGGKVAARSAFGVEEFASGDTLTVAECEAVARRMARYRPATKASLASLDAEASATDPGLPALLGIDDMASFDPAVHWRGRTGRDRLRVPIGFTPAGTAVELDIKESAHGGTGPHGLCIGATGSGKSEFLRTLVVGMLATHSPAELNLVLVDFKGGATFLGLDQSPHVAAVITNLEQELAMVDRMKDALSGELNRRQELLRAAGNFANVTEYEQARRAGATLAPLPALFVIVDEFSELLAQKPDFAELFVAIGRLGRSLHIHLLLASQRLEEGKLRGLDSHLSYRIGLKTFSANESRSVLGVPDAYHLPSVPGSAYLKCDAAEPVRFNTSYVSGPYHSPAALPGTVSAGIGPAAVRHRMRMFTALPVPMDPDSAATAAPDSIETPGAIADAGGSVLDRAAALLDEAPPETPDTDADLGSGTAPAVVPTLLQTLVGRIAGHGPSAHEVWLPPLDESPTVDALVGDRDFGLPATTGSLRVAVGIVDRPFDQRRDVHVLDLSGAAGNVAVVGGPQTGKSTALRSLILSAAATHTPEQVQFYVLDFGGGALTGIAGLPHVGSVATRGDLDAVRRTVAEVAAIIRARESRFVRLGIESMADYRARRRDWMTTGACTDDDPLADDLHGDVFLVIDGIGVVRSELDFLEDQIATIATQGLSYGVHLVVSATRWADVRPAMRDLIGSRVELRLGDAMDSEVGRREASTVPHGRPGRGLSPDGLHLLIALPRLDGDPSPASLPGGVALAVAAVGAAYDDRAAMPVRKLGTEISLESVRELVAAGGVALRPNQVVIGVGELELSPVVLDFTTQPHFMAFADAECGKTALLRAIVTGLVANSTPEEVKIVLVDYRRTLLSVITGDHLAGYASTGENATTMMRQLAAYFTKRLPPEDLTVEQLRDRSWWSGPDVYVIVDDYDMVATSSGNPLLALLDLAAHARDIGMHLVLARRSGGLGRAMFDPVIARLKDLSCDMLLMSGDRDEGYITGRTRLQRLVPGRGELVSRTRVQEMIQVGLADSDPGPTR